MPSKDPEIARVRRAVPALVRVQLDARRPRRRAPVLARLLVAQVDVAAGLIDRDCVVAIAGHAPVARVAVEGVPAAGVGDDAAVAALADVVDPWRRRVRPGDDVLACGFVEVAVCVCARSSLTSSSIGLQRPSRRGTN